MIKENKVFQFIESWKVEFIERIKRESGSKKQNFKYKNAVEFSQGRKTPLDKVMIEYLEFINSNPLQNNDYFKYVNSYKKGKKLNEKYFKHDKSKLHDYYKKVDANKTGYNPFDEYQYRQYVLFMMLKFSDAYESRFDDVFNVKRIESREYNPLTSIPSVLRQSLPFEIKEFDIAQAYPSFIFKELEIEPFDIYKLIDKKKFNSLLNTHKGVKGATIEAVRTELEPIYKTRVNEVVTDERFNEKGKLFNDLAKYEAEYIQMFVDENKPKYFVRLHDGVVTLQNEVCNILEFGNIQFKVKEFKKPKNESEIVNFYDSNGGTSAVYYARFFKQEGFLRITREGHDYLSIIKNENRIVTPINHKTDIVPFLKKNINEFNTDEMENRIARDSKNLIQQGLELLNPIRLDYHKDTREQVDIPFKNGVLRVTKDGQEIIPYSEIKGFFTEHKTQQFDYEIRDYRMSDFEKFLVMAITKKDVRKAELTDEDNKKVLAFFSMFGYLISNYKNSAESPAIIFSDENANDVSRNGGRGKSATMEALKQFRKSIEKPGSSYDPNYTHVHADLKQEHDLFLIDDVPAKFDYNAHYTNITGSIDAQRKGKPAETIEFRDTPKFVISTNWAVRYDENATSTNRRFVEYQFTDFWSINNEPKDVFDKMFFSDDWSKDDWNDFYNFGVSCVQIYLAHGLQRIAYDKRKDNYLAYYHNEVIEEETERIIEELKGLGEFNVTKVLQEHKRNDLFTYKPHFNKMNAKKLIELYIEYHKLPFIYLERVRRWKYVM